jgi:hypothetical protein
MMICKGRTIRNPGRGGGGGGKIPQKNSCKEKCLEKKFVPPLRQRKKFVQASTNSLEKKFLQRLNALKKILQRHETEKKFVPQKFYSLPPGISNGPPLKPNFSYKFPPVGSPDITPHIAHITFIQCVNIWH